MKINLSDHEFTNIYLYTKHNIKHVKSHLMNLLKNN